jgi:oxygen-dependent protoporphyrinogen oxidase
VAAQPGLAVCGAAYDGIGIPACIASARLAVDHVLAYLATKVPAPRP